MKNDSPRRPPLRERNMARILLALPLLAWISGYAGWHVFGDYDNQVAALIACVVLVVLIRLELVAERN